MLVVVVINCRLLELCLEPKQNATIEYYYPHLATQPPLPTHVPANSYPRSLHPLCSQ